MLTVEYVPGPMREVTATALWRRSWFWGVPQGALAPKAMEREHVDEMVKRAVKG